VHKNRKKDNDTVEDSTAGNGDGRGMHVDGSLLYGMPYVQCEEAFGTVRSARFGPSNTTICGGMRGALVAIMGRCWEGQQQKDCGVWNVECRMRGLCIYFLRVYHLGYHHGPPQSLSHSDRRKHSIISPKQ